MERINYNSLRFLEFIDSFNPRNSGIFFSILLHLIILLSAVGLPNFFGPKDIYVPNIIPIEILNVSDTTNIKKTESQNETSENTSLKQKKFNSSNNTEIQKKFEITENTATINDNDQPTIKVKEKVNQQIKEKKNIQIKQKENIMPKTKIETLKSSEIKPKIKPKPIEAKPILNTSDVNIEPKNTDIEKEEKKNLITKPKPKPKEDFSIASMLKDLRNEKSNNVADEENKEDDLEKVGQDNQNENMVLSISEIDLLRQQLSLCWNAPAGAVINIGDKVTISAKVQQNMEVYQNSVRIVDTNISKSNPFYGPITDSAMRTLLNPECTPLKLPENKYKLWKNLTITFDYSIMKGY